MQGLCQQQTVPPLSLGVQQSIYFWHKICRSDPGCTLGLLLVLPPGMSATSVSRRMSQAAEKQNLLMFFGLARGASIERWLLTDQFTPQLIGKSRWEGGEWGKGGSGVRCKCVISPPSISCFCLCVCVCSVIQCGLTLWDPMDCSMPCSLVRVLSAHGKWPVISVLKLDCVCGLVKTECDAIGGNLSDMVTQEHPST